MSYQLAFLLSALVVNSVHSYLLVSQRKVRKPTISEHAAFTSTSLRLYIIGHIIGGALFLIFAYQYYVMTVDLAWLFGLTICMVTGEYVQAFLPAKGRTNIPHTIAALVMWMLFLAFGVLSIIFVPVSAAHKLLAAAVYTVLIVLLVRGSKDWDRIYAYQMVIVVLFFVAMGVLVL